ncbi:MAG: hypothetical protein AABY15_03215 [Nanoarchaeota archaeon]
MKELSEEEILKEMGWTIVCQSPYEIEHEDGSTARGQSTQIVIDGIVADYHAMKAEEEEEEKLNKKLEATKDLNLTLINGNEIIAFLNKESKDNEDWDDISISSGSFVFEGQRLEKGIYTLGFTGSYNNWGEEQDIDGNYIEISNKGVKVKLMEPFEGDGTDDVLEEALTNWLKTHKFDSNPDKKFIDIVTKAHKELGQVRFTSKKELQQVIDQLIEAKTYMK